MLNELNATILAVDYGTDVVLTVEIAKQSITDLNEKIGFYGAIKNE